MGKTEKWLLLLCLFFLLPRSAARADGWTAEPSPPLLPGAEEIMLFLEKDAVCLRANVFSQGEAIAREAVLENGCLTIRLARPLLAGETARVLLEGESASGSPLFFDHAWHISRYSALQEEASLLKARWDGLTAADEQAWGAFAHSLLSPCAQIAHVIQYDSEKLSVGLDDAPEHWNVTLHDGRDGFGCTFSAKENAYIFANVGSGLRPERVEAIRVSSSVPFGSRCITAEFLYSSKQPFSLRSVSLLLKKEGIQPGFFWKADFQQDTAQCTFWFTDSVSSIERVWTERMDRP